MTQIFNTLSLNEKLLIVSNFLYIFSEYFKNACNDALIILIYLHRLTEQQRKFRDKANVVD